MSIKVELSTRLYYLNNYNNNCINKATNKLKETVQLLNDNCVQLLYNIEFSLAKQEKKFKLKPYKLSLMLMAGDFNEMSVVKIQWW